MKSGRRIGTFTAGFSLILLGAALLFYTFFPNYAVLEIALRLWPVILILLGIELLCMRFSNAEQPLRIDFASVLLMILCIGFAFACEIGRFALLYLFSINAF